MEKPVNAKVLREALENNAPLTKESPKGLKVTQITSGESANGHIYMESRVFTPDSKRFVFERYLNPEESQIRKMIRNFYLCNIEDDFALVKLTDEKKAIAPSVTRDGRYMYYIVDETKFGGGSLKIKRVSLDDFKRETVACYSGIGGVYPVKIYNLSSISSDSSKLCVSAFLGDGKTKNAPWGLFVIDLMTAKAKLVLQGSDYDNMHPQYCQSDDPKESCDILVQHNHDCEVAENGDFIKLVGGNGADIHVIKDDGTDFRSIPCGRDGNESCQGHQEWRGKMNTVITHTSLQKEKLRPAFESLPLKVKKEELHNGNMIKGQERNEITSEIEKPYFVHSAFDPTGTKFVSDDHKFIKEKAAETTCLYIGTLPKNKDAKLKVKYLLHPRATFLAQYTHPHPFLSPDGNRAFFNSDLTGRPHIWMVEGYEYPV